MNSRLLASIAASSLVSPERRRNGRVASTSSDPILNQRHIQKAWTYVRGQGLGAFLVRSTSGTGVVRIAAMVASFAVGVQIARGLGVATYGYYTMALSIIAIVSIPGEMGLPKVVTREVAASRARHDSPRLFGILRWADNISIITSALAAVGVAGAGGILVSLGSRELGAALILGAPIIPFMILSRIRGGALQGLGWIVRGQIPANLIRPMIFSLLLAPMTIAGVSFGAGGVMSLYSITAACSFFIAHRWLKQRLPAKVPAQVVKDGRRWITSCIPMGLTDGMRSLQLQLSVALLAIWAPPTAVGLFGVANATATTASTAMPIVGRVALPVIARLHADDDPARLQKAVSAFALAQFGGVVLLSLPLLLFPSSLLGLAFGESFEAAATTLRVILAGQIGNAFFGPNVILLNMTHHEREVTRAMAIALVLNIILVPIGVFLWGVVGAAMAFVISLLTWNIITWADAKRLLGIDTSVALSLNGVLRT
jgi:O-antigen/teichoic acid export membrane protein